MKVKWKEYGKERLSDKAFVAIILIYLLLCVASAIFWLVDLNVRNLIMSLAFTLFVPLLVFAEFLIGLRCGPLFTGGVLFLAFGAILGTCFDFYTLIPFFDLILHTLAGFLFACFGFTLAEVLFGRKQGAKHFIGCLIFAMAFSLAIAVFWEIFEYICSFLGFDMQEDEIVRHISSYLLAGGHAETVELDNIVQTVIYYGNGQTFTLEGYLDLGLLDTLTDMIVCTVGTVLFAIPASVGYKKCPKLNGMLIPKACSSPSGQTEE